MKTQCCVGSCKVTMVILLTIQHVHLWKPVIPQPFDVRCTHGPLLRGPNSISEPCCPTMLLREVSKSSNGNYKLLLTFSLIIGCIRVQCFGKGDKIDYANMVGECTGNSQLKPPVGPVYRKFRNFSRLFRVPQFFLYVRNAEVLRHQTS